MAESAGVLDVDVIVEADAWAAHGDLPERLERALTMAAAEEGGAGAVALLLADDAALRALNHEWRGKDKPTNVLSFPAPPIPGMPQPHMGDIALAFETVAAEAADQGKSFADHATHLAVHGFLHLIGYDHENGADAEHMEARERAILAKMGIADPYESWRATDNMGK